MLGYSPGTTWRILFSAFGLVDNGSGSPDVGFTRTLSRATRRDLCNGRYGFNGYRQHEKRRRDSLQGRKTLRQRWHRGKCTQLGPSERAREEIRSTKPLRP